MGPDIYAEYGTTFTTQNAIYIHGPGNDEPILRQTGPSAIAKFYHQDGLGSVVAVSTVTGMTSVFDDFGRKLKERTPTPRRPASYTTSTITLLE